MAGVKARRTKRTFLSTVPHPPALLVMVAKIPGWPKYHFALVHPSKLVKLLKNVLHPASTAIG
jgi:hypothetical protein